MDKTSCIIIDDERLARTELRRLLSAHPEVNILAEAANADEAIPLINQHQPDFIFLDIQMPGKNGFDLLEEMTATPLVVFTTAYDQYAIKAFEVQALDYLLKPLHENRLKDCIQKITNQIRGRFSEQAETVSKKYPNQIFVRDGELCHFITTDQIEVISSYGNYARIYFNGQSTMLKKSLSYIEDRLDTDSFFRANRTELFNVKMIQSIEQLPKGKLKIALKSGQEIEVSERKSVIFKLQMSL